LWRLRGRPTRRPEVTHEYPPFMGEFTARIEEADPDEAAMRAHLAEFVKAHPEVREWAENLVETQLLWAEVERQLHGTA